MQIPIRSKVYYLYTRLSFCENRSGSQHKTHDVHVDSKARVYALIFLVNFIPL